MIWTLAKDSIAIYLDSIFSRKERRCVTKMEPQLGNLSTAAEAVPRLSRAAGVARVVNSIAHTVTVAAAAKAEKAAVDGASRSAAAAHLAGVAGAPNAAM